MRTIVLYDPHKVTEKTLERLRECGADLVPVSEPSELSAFAALHIMPPPVVVVRSEDGLGLADGVGLPPGSVVPVPDVQKAPAAPEKEP